MASTSPDAAAGRQSDELIEIRDVAARRARNEKEKQAQHESVEGAPPGNMDDTVAQAAEARIAINSCW